MVNGVGFAAVEARLFRGGQVTNVPEIRDGETAGRGPDSIGFVELIVEDEKFLPFRVGYPPLVRVCWVCLVSTRGSLDSVETLVRVKIRYVQLAPS